MAELSDEEKDAISHRGRAVRALAEWLSNGDSKSNGRRRRRYLRLIAADAATASVTDAYP